MSTENTADPQKWTGYNPDDFNPRMDEDFIKMVDEILAKYPDSDPLNERGDGPELRLCLRPVYSLRERHEAVAFAREALDRNGFASWTIVNDDVVEKSEEDLVLESDIYIETVGPVDQSQLRKFLEGQGHKVLDIRNVSSNQDGIILTDHLLQDHWEHDTSQRMCTGQCAGTDRQHVSWEKLSESQRRIFANAMASFLTMSLEDHSFIPQLFLQENEEFDHIALKPC